MVTTHFYQHTLLDEYDSTELKKCFIIVTDLSMTINRNVKANVLGKYLLGIYCTKAEIEQQH